jgi:hypothetical protein
VLAEGVIAAVRDLNVQIPVVIRMKGNNEERGKEMLRQSGLNFITADEMGDAARKVVAAAGGATPRKPAADTSAEKPKGKPSATTSKKKKKGAK